MTERQLENILKLVKATENNCSSLSVADLKNLEAACEHELYARSVKDFRKHAIDIMPTIGNNSEDDWTEFNNLDWTISFGSKSVTIKNTAFIHAGMLDMLKEYINNCL